jgi:D-sedoheptulose 7-phosphate isomerase
MLQLLFSKFESSRKAQDDFIHNSSEVIIKIINLLEQTFKSGNKLLLCGNGGSASDAQHLAGEFVNKILFERSPLPAIALTTDTAVLTSIANDVDYKSIFSKQIQALGKKDDVLFAYSTSGNSPNIIEAVNTAKSMQLKTVGFTGIKGKLKDIVDIPVMVPSSETPRIQEVHYIIGHVICELIEASLFG